MRGVFDEQSEQAKPRGDTELTLGAGALLLIVFGLVLVCGLCFGLGYAVGHHGAPSAEAGEPQAAGAQTPLQANGSLPKPSATAQPAATPPAQSATPQTAQTGSGAPPQSKATVPAGAQQTAGQQTGAAGSSSGEPQVHPALAPAANPPQATAAPNVQPALPAAVPLMVQIAAVSHQEDADVLVGALRKRGYQVSARREPVDDLIHVRIGPFSDRDEANRWRLKLLDDGYNAIVQP